MLIEKVEKNYDKALDLNCAECILYSANEEYNMGLDLKGLKLAAGFGGGMAVEDACGAMTGAVMVLGVLFVKEKAHESDRIKTLTKELIERFNAELKTQNCRELKSMYRDDDKRCFDMVKTAALILDDIVNREMKMQ